eukprot:CAMPEP_0204622278 /NCGR_PEP_ID=MMETSP0717-20131115/7927_1 /ASSEMBLY_ACC=CAM_ASM_000666 /TAXON_ID=230516 /ORGANISM="Chaetoceros curvisetus" /LENGTH=314 /DNA_ID=CAMNT_0051636935 /DNA_START=39 /DNA_END=980 /DNA_ORIENTATION=-
MKTLMKSSKVSFTMLGGMTMGKRYRRRDFVAVAMLIFGLSAFIYADIRSASVLFRPVGVAMLMLSLVADGAFVNFAELFMKKYNLSQDEFLLTIDSLSCVAMLGVAFGMGELVNGFTLFFLRDGSIRDIITTSSEGDIVNDHGDHADIIMSSSSSSTSSFMWTVTNKSIILILFTFTGLLGTSSANAMVKYFGALNMSIVTTSRKAFTLFLSFLAFDSNHCTSDHFVGMVVFLSGLVVKSTNGAGNQILNLSLTPPSSCPDFSTFGSLSTMASTKEKIQNDDGINDDDDFDGDKDIATNTDRQSLLKRRALVYD